MLCKIVIAVDALYFIEKVIADQKYPLGTWKLKGVLTQTEVNEDEVTKAKATRAGFAFLLNFVNIKIQPQLLYMHFASTGLASDINFLDTFDRKAHTVIQLILIVKQNLVMMSKMLHLNQHRELLVQFKPINRKKISSRS
ncbi:Hypothetical_protein [Hexamita inflata]|uniref:Hypothetical_protein n=1 Tax=Hexamita inflata TaxID=28002 RepID=A0ABP1HQN7_9EUKA